MTNLSKIGIIGLMTLAQFLSLLIRNANVQIPSGLSTAQKVNSDPLATGLEPDQMLLFLRRIFRTEYIRSRIRRLR